MQPILMLAIVGVAATALGTGFLMNNEILLNVQNFGVGEENILSPITSANIDFQISKITAFDVSGGNIFKNVIDACSFHSDQDLEAGSKVICKLTDSKHNVIAEGFKVFPNGLLGSDRDLIPIMQTAFPGSNDVRNIKDVTIIVIGPDPTTGFND